MDENKLNTVVKTTLESIKQIVDVNTVVGEPITTPSGTTIIPVSKVSIGYVSGGSDFVSKRANTKNNFTGGGGTGVSLLPVGFLAVKPEGDVQFIPVEKAPGTPGASVGDAKLESIFGFIEKSPDIVAKFKSLFSKKDEEEEEE